MVENVDNIVLEQLRPIRETPGQVQRDIKGLQSGMTLMKAELKSDLGDLKAEIGGQTGLIVALGGYIHSIDQRVEHIEKKIGGAA